MKPKLTTAKEEIEVGQRYRKEDETAMHVVTSITPTLLRSAKLINPRIHDQVEYYNGAIQVENIQNSTHAVVQFPRALLRSAKLQGMTPEAFVRGVNSLKVSLERGNK